MSAVITFQCGAFQPVEPGYRCSRDVVHKGNHWAEVDDQRLAEWKRRVTDDPFPEPPLPNVIELDANDVREMLAEFAAAADARQDMRVMLDTDGFKVSVGHHRWTHGVGERWS